VGAAHGGQCCCGSRRDGVRDRLPADVRCAPRAVRLRDLSSPSLYQLATLKSPAISRAALAQRHRTLAATGHLVYRSGSRHGRGQALLDGRGCSRCRERAASARRGCRCRRRRRGRWHSGWRMVRGARSDHRSGPGPAGRGAGARGKGQSGDALARSVDRACAEAPVLLVSTTASTCSCCARLSRRCCAPRAISCHRHQPGAAAHPRRADLSAVAASCRERRRARSAEWRVSRVRLFVERARQQVPIRAPRQRRRGGGICRQLDGIRSPSSWPPHGCGSCRSGNRPAPHRPVPPAASGSRLALPGSKRCGR